MLRTTTTFFASSLSTTDATRVMNAASMVNGAWAPAWLLQRTGSRIEVKPAAVALSMKSSVTVSPHAPSVGASNVLPKFTPRPIAVAVAVALADAPGAASFAIGGYAPMSGTFWGPGAAVLLPPAQPVITTRATTGNAVRRTHNQRVRCTRSAPRSDLRKGRRPEDEVRDRRHVLLILRIA